MIAWQILFAKINSNLNQPHHWIQYLRTNATCESTTKLLASQISETEAQRYPIDILCNFKEDHIKKIAQNL